MVVDAGAIPRGFRTRLARRAQRAGLTIPDDLADGLIAYYQLLSLWNQRINLTSIGEPDQAIDRLLLEPLLAARQIDVAAPSAIDIGSGGGSPAIPLKLALPAMTLVMVESKARKTAFLREAVRQLQLVGVRVETARYEELLVRPELHDAMDVVTLRAVRVDGRTLANLQAFLKPAGKLLLFRALGASDIPGLPPTLSISATVPLIESLRSRLLVIEKRRPGAV